jgi:hypothetical protein
VNLSAFAGAAAIGLLIASVRVEAENLNAARLCAANKDATARLACYDAAFAVVSPAPTAQFGDNEHLQKLRTPTVDTPKSLELTVKSAQPLQQGLFRLTLDNGQVWETRQADWSLAFKPSDVVTISRLPLGGYQISMKGNPRTLGVRRIH